MRRKCSIMGMYQVDTSPENVDLEDDEEEERMSTWVNSLIFLMQLWVCIKLIHPQKT